MNQPEPQEAIDIASGIHNLEGYKNLMNGAYDAFQGTAQQYIDVGSLMADNTEWNGSFPGETQFATRDMSSNNDYAARMWNDGYRAINRTNIILDQAVGKLQNVSQQDFDNIAGQAHFLRALIYYYLVQYFALPWGATADNSQMGVPLKLKPVTNSTEFKSLKRSSVSEVYGQILKDLKEAEGKITNMDPAKPTNYAVLALEARIALIQQRWSAADSLAAKVIPHFTLNSDVATYFRKEFSSESIFELANTPTDNMPDVGNTGLSAAYGMHARKDILISDSYKNALKNIVDSDQKTALKAGNQTAIDTRVTELLASSKENPQSINDYNYTNKYEDFVHEADNVPILRLSEMILTSAEALAEMKGVNQGSIDLLNKIRTRAIKVRTGNGASGNEKLIEYKVSDFANKEQLINTILLERRVELSFEGHRKTDLQRHHLDVRGLSWDADRLVVPIPLSQTDADKNIKQNPGY
jgi:hypothetical protein